MSTDGEVVAQVTAVLSGEPMTDDEYVEAGGCECPRCRARGEALSYDRIQSDVGSAWAQCSCSKCDAVWTEFYDLIGYAFDDTNN